VITASDVSVRAIKGGIVKCSVEQSRFVVPSYRYRIEQKYWVISSRDSAAQFSSHGA